MFAFRPAARLLTPAAALAAALLVAGCGAAQPGAAPAPATLQARASGESDVLTRAQIERINANDMEHLMTGRFNGARVFRNADGEPVLLIRSNHEPLIVMDGIPGISMASFWRLDPMDIEEIRVLRETGASLYGLEGASGVLVVKTRRR